jgi:hypothetical protein
MVTRTGPIQQEGKNMFPVDWNEWQSEWTAWQNEHKLTPSRDRKIKPNMLADEVIGWFRVMGREVELSAVTMPEFGARPERRLRFVGITWLVDDDLVNGGLVDSFAELADTLARGPQEEGV